ncbi:hypothetical protein E4U21_001547 [Claviceps maximensis]|nr:hypothetical protein E4U21_001547 [Claviceps maximensis]
MDRFREVLARSSSLSPRHNHALQVQLEIVSIPEDCTMKDDDSVELVPPPDSEIVYSASRLEALEQSKKIGEKSHVQGKSEEEEDKKPAANMILRNRLVSPTRDDFCFRAEKLRDERRINALQKLVLVRNNKLSTLSRMVKSLACDLAEVINTSETNLSMYYERTQSLEAQIADYQEMNSALITLNLRMRKRLRQRGNDPGEAAALAIGGKVSDGELKSQWKQLKFSVVNLALLIDEIIPDDRCPPLGRRDRRLSGGKKSKLSRLMFKNPNLKRWAIEHYLWLSIFNIVFESRSRSDRDKAGRNFKDFKRSILKNKKSARLGSYCKWFCDGWQITKPSDEAIGTMVQNDCGGIYELVYGNKELEDGADKFLIKNELVEIFTLAMELDDMRMQSLAIITFDWYDLGPGKHDPNHTGYFDATMNAVNMKMPPEDASVQLIITPAMLKRGNANGGNYDSEMVLAKADVFMYGEEEQK